MATIPLRPLEVIGSISGNSPQKLSFQEAASQTFKKGAVVALNSSGLLIEASDNPTNVVGVAEQDGHNYTATSTTNRCEVTIANTDTIFMGNLSGSSVTALLDIGKGYSIAKTGNNWHVVKTDLTNRRVRVIQLDPRDAVGDTNGRVWFQFHAAASYLTYTS